MFTTPLTIESVNSVYTIPIVTNEIFKFYDSPHTKFKHTEFDFKEEKPYENVLIVGGSSFRKQDGTCDPRIRPLDYTSSLFIHNDNTSIITTSIADGLGGHKLEELDLNIARLAKVGCDEANIHWSNQVQEYWKQNPTVKDPNTIYTIKKTDLKNDEYGIGKIKQDMCANNLPLINKTGEGAAVCTYSIKKIDNQIRITGWTIGDLLVLGYSPSQKKWYNICPMVQNGISPEGWSYQCKEFFYSFFDATLPNDIYIIGGSDGIGDVLPRTHKLILKPKNIQSEKQKTADGNFFTNGGLEKLNELLLKDTSTIKEFNSDYFKKIAKDKELQKYITKYASYKNISEDKIYDDIIDSVHQIREHPIKVEKLKKEFKDINEIKEYLLSFVKKGIRKRVKIGYDGGDDVTIVISQPHNLLEEIEKKHESKIQAGPRLVPKLQARIADLNTHVAELKTEVAELTVKSAEQEKTILKLNFLFKCVGFSVVGLALVYCATRIFHPSINSKILLGPFNFIKANLGQGKYSNLG